MIYKLDYRYAADHTDFCLIVEIQRTKEEVACITAALQLLLEDVTNDVSAVLDTSCLMDVLEEYYWAVNVKDEFQLLLSSMRIPENEWDLFHEFQFEDVCITQIDMYEARDFCLQENFDNMDVFMQKFLPTGEKRRELETYLLEHGRLE